MTIVRDGGIDRCLDKRQVALPQTLIAGSFSDFSNTCLSVVCKPYVDNNFPSALCGVDFSSHYVCVSPD